MISVVSIESRVTEWTLFGKSGLPFGGGEATAKANVLMFFYSPPLTHSKNYSFSATNTEQPYKSKPLCMPSRLKNKS